MKNLLIIGARGYGREVYSNALDSIGYNTEFTIKGFLDDKTDALDGYDGYPPIIDSVEEYNIHPDDVFICALGDVNYKKIYVDKILAKGGKFINIISKDAFVDRNTTMGVGCIVCRRALISCDIKIGDFVTFQAHCDLGHDAKVGSFCQINSFAFMGGYAEIGDFVTLHTGAIIHPHVKVADHAIVGAGAVVIRKVKEGTTVYGNPATTLKY